MKTQDAQNTYENTKLLTEKIIKELENRKIIRIRNKIDKLIEAPKGKNLFLISYDKNHKDITSEIIRKRILFCLKMNGAFIHKEPVETTLLFSSDKLIIDWIGLVRGESLLKGIYFVIVETKPSDINGIYLKKSDPELQTGIEEEMTEVMNVIKNPTIESIKKLLLPPKFHSPQ